jgi:hypothetical protein
MLIKKEKLRFTITVVWAITDVLQKMTTGTFYLKKYQKTNVYQLSDRSDSLSTDSHPNQDQMGVLSCMKIW